MKPSIQEKLDRYRPVFTKYEASGDPRAEVQRRLIAKLEAAQKERDQ